jgi:hypothetical protein
MNEEIKKTGIAKDAPNRAPKAKRTYQKPAFEHERVFETMALACGKLSASQGQCHLNRKRS